MQIVVCRLRYASWVVNWVVKCIYFNGCLISCFRFSWRKVTEACVFKQEVVKLVKLC